MIENKCFSWNWIQDKRKLLGSVDPTLLEKTIYAFELLGRLCAHRFDFVFKGGTCLLLIIPGFRRLSIDVDIVTQAEAGILSKIFDKSIHESPFLRWIEDPRTAIHIPKKHFKFFFKSAINNREDYILLDVVCDDYVFPQIQLCPIELDIFQVEKEIQVKVPTVNCLVGDKLTAFAPSTIGVLYHADRSMQIIKQLFDLGELFKSVTDFKEISESYDAFLKKGNTYREKNYTKDDTLEDTIDACYLISQLGFRQAIENDQTRILRDGIRKLQSHLINIHYSNDDAKLSAAKVAFVTSVLIKGRDFPDPKKFKFNSDRISHIKDIQLRGKYQVLNRLKSVLPEAFYYWFLATATV